MAEFQFYVIEEDHVAVLETIFQLPGARLIPNDNYQTSDPSQVMKVTPELLHSFSVNPRCYIAGAFTVLPIEMIKMEKGKYAGTYVVAENLGGPLICLSLPKPLKRHADGGMIVPPSRFTHPQKFWDEGGGHLLPASAELKLAYRTIKQSVTRLFHRKHLDGPVLLGPSTKDQFVRREISLLVNGRGVKFSGG